MMNFNLPQSCQHFDLPRFHPNLPLFDFLQSLRKFIVNGSFAMYNEYDKNYPEVLAVMDPPGGGGIAAKLLKSFGRAVKLLKKEGKGGKKKGIQI